MTRRNYLTSALRRLIRKFRKPKREMHQPLWRTLEANLHLGPVISSSEWATLIRIVAKEMNDHIVEHAGPPIGDYYKQSPVEWLLHESMRAANRL